jgi:hypothetical protein
MPRLAVAVGRVPAYRTLGAVIQAALDDPFWDVELILGPSIPAGEWKSYQNPTLDNIPAPLRGRCHATVVATPAELSAQVSQADAVVSDVGRSFLTGDETESVDTPLWCAVFDADHSTQPSNRFRHAAITSWPTRYYVDWAMEEDPDAAEDIAAGAHEAGYVRSDALAASSRRETRREWNLPQDRPVVLYIPDGYRLRDQPSHTTAWYRRVWCAERPFDRVARAAGVRRRRVEVTKERGGHAAVVGAVREFCDTNGALLALMPRREKNYVGRHAFTRDELGAADVVIADTENYPQTLPRAAQMADLVVTPYRGGSLLDAVAAGVPCVTVALPPQAYTEAVHRYAARFDREQGHHPGATWLIAADELVRSFGGRSLTEFAINPEVLARMRARYVGPVDGRCARRVLDAIASRLVGAAR